MVGTRVLVAPDKLKGTLTAVEAARAMAIGWLRGEPEAEVDEAPIADGGDGTLDTLVAALGGEVHRVDVSGPLGDAVDAAYGLADGPDGRVAIVEMARASGLELVGAGRRNPLRASTRGTGELIRAAAAERPDRILVCIGGSATNDAGAGMAQALGIRLLDEGGNPLAPGGAALSRLASIDVSGLDPALQRVEVVVAVDVDNTLTGPTGASAVYGPQKGATPDDVALLDAALGHFAAVVHRDLGLDIRDLPGAGAAGGLGGGLVAFLGARLRPGFAVVAEVLGLGERVASADVVLTGEGRFDSQSARGKAPAGVLRMAFESGRPSILVAGQVEAGVETTAETVISLEERFGIEASMTRTAELLTRVGEELASARRRSPDEAA